jgi:hypothetical protein
MNKKPKIIDLGFKVDESKVKNLELPVREIDIAHLSENADICYLEKEGTDDWNLSPRALINDFENQPSHAKRVKSADLDFPIYVYNHNSHLIILDGVHRFTKALMNGDKKIKIKIVPQEKIESLKG